MPTARPITAPPLAPAAPVHDALWLRSATRALRLSYFSLVWMLAEAVVGFVAGAEAGSIGVIAWAIGSAVEAAAAVIVIVRLTGANRFSERAERRAQKWVAGSFFILVPYVLYEAAVKLIDGSQPELNWLAVAVLASSVVVMPALGQTKRRLGERLASGATAGEGTQNLLCAVQAAVALVGLVLGSAGAGFLDPFAALIIAGIAANEGAELWRGHVCACHALSELEKPSVGRADEGFECC